MLRIFRASEHLPSFGAAVFGHAFLAPIWFAVLFLSSALVGHLLLPDAPAIEVMVWTAVITILFSEAVNLMVYRVEAFRQQQLTPSSMWVTGAYAFVPATVGVVVGMMLDSVTWGVVVGACAFLTVSQILLWVFKPWKQGRTKEDLDASIRRAIREVD